MGARATAQNEVRVARLGKDPGCGAFKEGY